MQQEGKLSGEKKEKGQSGLRWYLSAKLRHISNLVVAPNMTQIDPRQTPMCSLFNVASVDDAGIPVKGKTHMNSKWHNATGMYNPRNVMKTSTMAAQRSGEDNCVNGAHPTDLHMFIFYVGIFQFLANVGIVWFDSCDSFFIKHYCSSSTFLLFRSAQKKKNLKQRYMSFSWAIKPFVFSKTCIF